MAVAPETQLMDMFYLSETKPRIPESLISRDQYLDFLDRQLEDRRVLCVEGEEGVGVTTFLALFAKRHGRDCASYFNNGWSRHLLSPKAIVRSILRQLSFYTKVNLDPEEEETTLVNCIFRLNRLTRNKDKYIYFVFDGFDLLPAVFVNQIKDVLAPLFSVDNARFVFSGRVEDVKVLLPDSVDAKQTNDLLRFQNNDVDGFLKVIDPDLSKSDIDTIYDLSGKGVARQLVILAEKLQKYGIDKLHSFYYSDQEDFYAEDFDWIEEQEERLRLLIALLAFSETPLNKQSVAKVLSLSVKETERLLSRCEDYVEYVDNGFIVFRSDDFRKYLRGRMVSLKSEIELLLINVIEKSTDMGEQFMLLPALYKHVKDNKQLVDYLTSDKVQHYIVEQQSQAALNEQCEYGFNACSDFESQAAAYFRFALNKSVSRELEKNELSDVEIEALISIGEDEKAYGMTQSIFLIEEKLKCLLIIAQAGKHLSDAMREEIDRQIDTLASIIRFEHIPDKALELAKLMLPVKMEKALEIIDRVAKVTNDREQIDRLYTAISLSFNNEGKSDDSTMTQRADLASSRIEDVGLKKMASVMKTIMKENTAAQVVSKMKELPASQQLNFLQYWIPDHKKGDDVGDAVEYAVRLVIDTSQTLMPKVTLLKHYCKPLPDMPEKQVKVVVSLLDAVVANIKFPTVEYVKLMVLVITAVVKFDKKDAENRLILLYMEILDLKDKALQAHCKALILQNFSKLGDPSDVEAWIGKPAKDLEIEILNDISDVLTNSAYHLKAVEGPIAALVCTAPDFIKSVIAKMNTEERRSRAYLLATQEYIWQKDIKNLEWDYLIKLFNNIAYDRTELHKPLYDLVNKIIEVNDKDVKLLESVKKHYFLLQKAEQFEAQCYYYAQLYVWLYRNYETEIGFLQKVKEDLDRVWTLLNIPSVKADTGYHIAKVMSEIPMKKEAHDFVAKAAEVKKNQLLSSVSCLTAYRLSLELYAHSLGILIRSGLCTDDDIDQFGNLLEYEGSEIDAIILWSRVALEYYGVNDIERFNDIMNRFVTKPIDANLSIDDQKQVLFHIAPALYLSLESLFYDRLKCFDDYFWNACIENVAQYIQTKYPYPEYTSTNEIQTLVALEKSDYDKLLDLMRHTKSDSFIFVLTSSMTKTINQNVGKKLTREMQRALLTEMGVIIQDRLPMEGGIQHNGYLIACRTMIEASRPGGRVDPEKLKQDIEAIGNRADQAFIYAYVAEYLPSIAKKSEFIELAVQKTESIDYTFDKYNRYILCLQDSFTAAKAKSQSIATKVMNSLKADGNGSFSDYQRMLDLVRDKDEELADAMLEMVDDDPARIQYKKRLKQRAASSKKIEAARSDLVQVSNLTNAEQMRFFERQMECLIKEKTIVRDIDSTEPILTQVFQNPIADTQNAVLFFMENLHQKNQYSKKYNTLLREMHQAIVDNLKIVVAIASGTKERLERVSRIMNERGNHNASMILMGQSEKGVERILNWYKAHPVNIIKIIDPYFHAEDMFIIKKIMDLNNDLNCSILTNKGNKDESLSLMFQAGWNSVSSDLTGRVEVKSCGFKDNPSKAPFHDRWWLLYDDEDDFYYGIRLASPSTLGSRITEISDMDQDAISSVISIWNKYFVNMAKTVNGEALKYDETYLR